jgi:hypothetical protein
MAIWFWKVYDTRVVEACFLPAITLSVAIVAAILLPTDSGLMNIVGNTILLSGIILICKFCGAVFGRR